MYAENIFGVINTIVKDDNLAEEICQDVFVKVWNKIKSTTKEVGIIYKNYDWFLYLNNFTAL